MNKIAIYGKGGIGKSVVATSLSTVFALNKNRVLHVGCDPKCDSAIRLSDNPGQVKTVIDALGNNPNAQASSKILNKGRHGISLIEAGGPTAGLGCAGRGVAKTIEAIEDLELLDANIFDTAVFDVLGDVVCGGFASPLRQGFAEKIYIVASEEPMALFAANNIARAIISYKDNSICLGGLIANLRNNETANIGLINSFAQRIGTTVVETIQRSQDIIDAEKELKTVVEHAPDCEVTNSFKRLAETIQSTDPSGVPLPSPMSDSDFFNFLHKS